ncbi:MAG: PAS domain S-box protein [Bacteroidales bacterium]|nr:PAS domain S-box protein [Bacteroidales bacterium]
MDENFTSKNRSSVSEISVYQLVNAISDAAFVCDHTGRIIYCSDHVIPFFGISDKARVIGSSFQSYIAYEFIDEAYFMLSNTVNEGSNKKTGKFPVKKGLTETFYASITFAPIANDHISGNYILVTFREAPVADPEIGLLHKKDVRLSRLVEILSNTTVQSGDRTSKLVSQIGETLGAITCTYSRFEKGELLPYAAWESPFNKGITPQLFGKQIFDYLSDHKETLSLIRKPLLTEFLKSEPSYNEESGVKAILGFTVIKNKVVDGILTAVFPFNYTLSNFDKLFIQTISSVIENESSAGNDNTVSVEPSFRDLIDRFADPIFIISEEGILLEANESALKYYGYEREALIGQNPLLLSAEGKDDSELIRQMLEKTLNGQPQKFEWLVKNKKGEILPTEISLTKSNYKGQETVIAAVRDLTEMKKVVNELLRHNHELVESNLSKDKFFSIFAHDLKNPFQGLLGFIDLLYEDLDELSNDQVKEYLSNVRNASYHTYALLENLLEWSRIQSGKMPFTPTVFDIHDEISSVITVLDNNATQKDIKLINEVDSGIMVEADRNMIRSVIQNIVTNSIKFSNSNGRVVIRGRVPINYTKARNTTEPGDRQWLEISISDNGIGIPEEILPKLFKLNGQYSSAGTANEPGTGLGLVLCHEMVEKNGGRIWAESIPGQGTTFIFTIMLSN